MKYGIRIICKNCGYEFTDKELDTATVRKTDAVICPKCQKITYLE